MASERSTTRQCFFRSWLLLILLTGCTGTFEVGILPSQPAQSTFPPNTTSPHAPQVTNISPTPLSTDTARPEAATTVQDKTTPGSTATATPCHAPTAWIAYTVQTGDTLFGLAQQAGTTVQVIARSNCLSGDTLVVGQRLYLPFVASSTPSATITPSSTPTHTMPTIDPTAIWAPNGRQYATKAGVVVNIDTGQVASDMINPDSLQVYAWTSDSRYAVFASKNSFNSTHTYVFDAEQWKLTYSTNGCLSKPTGALTDNCGDFPVALASTHPYLLLENGSLVDLSSLKITSLWTSAGATSTTAVIARWAPDDSNLVWIATSDGAKTCSAYIAKGDGGGPRLAGILDSCPQSVEWLGTGAAQITTPTTRYLLDASSARLDVVSQTTPTPVAQATLTATAVP